MRIDRLKELRKQNNMTQTRIAKVLNVTQTAYAAYETGRSTPPSETILKIANLFSTTTDYILGNTNTAEKPKEKLVTKKQSDKIINHLDFESMTDKQTDDFINIAKQIVDVIKNK